MAEPRIAVADLANARWTAGGGYAEVMARILGDAAQRRGAPDVLHFSSVKALDAPGITSTVLPPVHPLPGEALVRRVAKRGPRSAPFPREGGLRRRLGVPDDSDALSAAARSEADVVFPVLEVPPSRSGKRFIAWIPDLQDRQMTELFSADFHAARAERVRLLGERCELIVVSSHAVAADLAEFYPHLGPKARVVAFPSLLAVRPGLPAEAPTSAIYHLPEHYFLCANQIWGHKNHGVVVDAVERLAASGTDATVVMTGLPLDVRSGTNDPTSDLLQRIAKAGVSDRVRFLGLVPGDHLVSLMRGSVAVLQPSRSEGWNTTVQDAKAFGVPTICSDLPVHLEQAPDSIGFHGVDDPDRLAELLRTALASADAERAGRDEAAALEREGEFARQQGDRLWAVCAEARGAA